MTKDITALELALLMQVSNVGEQHEEYTHEMTSVGVAIQQKIEEVLKNHPDYDQRDFLLAQRDNYEEGIKRLQQLSEYFEEVRDENFNA